MIIINKKQINSTKLLHSHVHYVCEMYAMFKLSLTDMVRGVDYIKYSPRSLSWTYCNGKWLNLERKFLQSNPFMHMFTRSLTYLHSFILHLFILCSTDNISLELQRFVTLIITDPTTPILKKEYSFC